MKICILLLALGLSMWSADALLETVAGSVGSLLGGKPKHAIFIAGCDNAEAVFLAIRRLIENVKDGCNLKITLILIVSSGDNRVLLNRVDVRNKESIYLPLRSSALHCPHPLRELYSSGALRLARELCRPDEETEVVIILGSEVRDRLECEREVRIMLSLGIKVKVFVFGDHYPSLSGFPGDVIGFSSYAALPGVLGDLLGDNIALFAFYTVVRKTNNNSNKNHLIRHPVDIRICMKGLKQQV